MRNTEVAGALNELADYAELQENQWEARAYRRAARTIQELDEPIEEVAARGLLRSLDGVGEAIASKIDQFLETGRMEALERARDEVGIDVATLLQVQGLGVKGLRTLHLNLGIRDLDELETAAREGRVAEVPGFGAKTQEALLEGIAFVRGTQGTLLLPAAQDRCEALVHALLDTGAVERVEVVGPLRRRLPSVDHLALVAVAHDPERALAATGSLPEVDTVVDREGPRAVFRLTGGERLELAVPPPEALGAALVTATGAPAHVRALARRAHERGWQLGPGGLVDGEGAPVAGLDEASVYGALELTAVPPELREGLGEVEAAAEDALPELITLDDVRGDLQMHTTWSDGRTSIEEMARKADALGYEYILVTDHGPSLTVAGGPDEDDLAAQRDEVRRVNDLADLRVTVLQGIEANILADGLDVSPEACAELDLVVAALHDKVTDATERILRTFEAYPVDVLAHPSNRLLGRREGNLLDMEAIVEAAAENRVALEINGQPDRLDLDWELVHRHRAQARFVVSTDAHRPEGLENMGYAVDQARKGWLSSDRVLNTRSLENLLTWFRGSAAQQGA